jgi:hypothetical protein
MVTHLMRYDGLQLFHFPSPFFSDLQNEPESNLFTRRLGRLGLSNSSRIR